MAMTTVAPPASLSSVEPGGGHQTEPLHVSSETGVVAVAADVSLVHESELK